MPLMRPHDILMLDAAGLYCKPGGFHIDPVRPVDRAVITHGHSDHARPGHRAVLATQETLDIMRLRYGDDFAGLYAGDFLWARDKAGRCLDHVSSRRGMCWVRRRSRSTHGGVRIVASGDYKDVHDPTCTPFEIVRCDVFITEATFGLPVFRHSDTCLGSRQAAGLRSRCFRSVRIWLEPIHLARRSA